MHIKQTILVELCVEKYARSHTLVNKDDALQQKVSMCIK